MRSRAVWRIQQWMKRKRPDGEQTLLSPKDICALDLIPEIAKAGVYSLKIEGRMKRPEYTAGQSDLQKICGPVPAIWRGEL